MSCNCQRPVREHADIPVPVALHELRHRYANELAATLASLQIARARGDGDRLIEEAIDRIEAQAKLARFLIEPPLRRDRMARRGHRVRTRAFQAASRRCASSPTPAARVLRGT